MMRLSIVLVLAAVLLSSLGCSEDESAAAPEKQTVSTPVFDPASGSYDSVLYIKITCSTADASVYYTADGTDPDESSTLFAAGDSIEVSSSAAFKARAYKDGMNPSDVAPPVTPPAEPESAEAAPRKRRAPRIRFIAGRYHAQLSPD